MDITYDWINRRLYILIHNTTAYTLRKYDLQQGKIEDLVSGFDSNKPIQIQVDPCNG